MWNEREGLTQSALLPSSGSYLLVTWKGLMKSHAIFKRMK